MTSQPASFLRLGPERPESPVILSVPHAGRDYPAALRAALRVPLRTAATLEDRHADRLAEAARGREIMLVAQRARAWIDLNRSETERDPRVEHGGGGRAIPLDSSRMRSGLGLVPRRAGGADLWRSRFDGREITRRIADDHRPYHQALARLLVDTRARFGVAVLLDVHSMPPLARNGSGAHLVLGDRFGQAAGARFVSRLEAVAQAAGLTSATNSPYAGGHVIDRHSRPAEGIHAVQIEFDRSLYLDSAFDSPGPGFAATARLLRAMIDAMTDEALDSIGAIAAE